MSRFQHTTLKITILVILLNPIAWILQYLFNKWNMEYLISNGVKVDELSQYVALLNFQIPLQVLATATVTAVGLYIGGQKGKSISYNLGQPAQSGIKESEGDK